MPETQEDITRDEVRTSMVETVLLLAFSLLMGLASLAICAWLVVSGNLFSMDGLALALISLTLGGFFMFNVAWSIHTGEFQEVLKYLRKGSSKSDA